MSTAHAPILQHAANEVLWPYLIAGIILALFGWVIYWTGVHVIGTFLGASLGMACGFLGGVLLELPETPALVMLCAGTVLGGIMGALLMRMIQYYFFFLIGASLGAPLAWKLLTMPMLASQPWAQSGAATAVAVVVGALIGGGIVLLLRRYVVSLVSALIGSTMIAVSIPYDKPELIALPCFVVSIVIQTGMIRAFIPKERVERVDRRAARKDSGKD